MKARYWIAAAVGAAVVLAAGTNTTVGIVRSTSFSNASAKLQATWKTDEQEGVPVSSLAPLQAQLKSQGPSQGWWSPGWWNNDGTGLISSLTTKTNAAYQAALASDKHQAQTVLDSWTTLQGQDSTWLTPAAISGTSTWAKDLAAANTPAKLLDLAKTWGEYVSQQRTAALAAQKAKLDSEMAAEGGPAAVLVAAKNLVGTATSANLDDQGVSALAQQLQSEINSGANPIATAEQLLTAVGKLQALIALNNQVEGQVRPVMLLVDQAQAQGTPNAGALASRYQTLATQFQAARDSDSLTAVQSVITGLQTDVQAELSSHQCGYAEPAGKVITVNLTLQEMVMYDSGCVVNATPVSTGRPLLRTPDGSFHIFDKQSPFQFISPWPVTSPFYYYPSWVSWVMEFNAGGYFIHDAPWEPVNDFGPGSENSSVSASHGCIHVPTPIMQWLYTWTPMGTAVNITG